MIMPNIISPSHMRMRFAQPIDDTEFAKIVLDAEAAI